jgi:hypothetical protein
MAQFFTTSIVTGQWFYATDASPNGVISAPRASLALRFDVGNASAWINVDGLTDWNRFLTVTTAGTLDLTSVSQVLIADNDATSIQIGSTGALSLLSFDTLNGAERVVYNGASPYTIASGGLDVQVGPVTLPEGSLNVASAASDAGNELVSAGLFLRATFSAGGGGGTTEDIILPFRAGGWRIVDAYITSGGAGGGSVQVQTAGAAAITNGMVPGAGAGDITRASNVNLTNGTVGSGATIRLVVAAGTAAGQAFIRVEGL